MNLLKLKAITIFISLVIILLSVSCREKEPKPNITNIENSNNEKQDSVRYIDIEKVEADFSSEDPNRPEEINYNLPPDEFKKKYIDVEPNTKAGEAFDKNTFN